MKSIFLFLLTAFFMFGCIVDQGKVAVDIKRKTKPTTNGSTTNPTNLSSASVSNVQIINNQLVISGAGLSSVTNVKVNGNSLNQNFTIESQSATQIIANAVNAFSFDVSKVFNLILSDAQAAATFPIDFSLCNATLNGKAFNCAVTANDKDVLSYDASTNKWKPRSVNGLTFQGSWDAHDPEPAGASAGDYYIVSVANAPYAVGDWIVWNGTAYDKISNSTTITSVFGRTGAIVATKGDYDLNKLTDIDLTVPPTIGKVLKYDGSKWVAGDDLSGGGAGSVTSAEIAAGAVTDAKIDTVSASKITGTITSAQIADGTIVNADISATAAIDYSKLNIPAGSIPYSKLNIANGDIPAAKISGLPAATAILTTTITDNDTTHAPDGNAVYDALAGKLNTTGGTLTVGTITGVPTPVNPSDVTNKSYVDSAIAAATPSIDTDDVPEGTRLYFTEPRVRATVLTGLNTGVAGPIAATDTVLSAAGKLQYQITDLKANGQWTKTGNDIAYSDGNVTIDKTLLLKDGGSNYVEIKAPAAVTSTYTLTLPPTAGTNNYVLKTDGNGVLSWVAVSDPNVQAFAKSALPTCSAGEVLKSNGTSFSCVTDATGAGSFTGTASRAVATDGSGALTTSATTATELGYVAGVTSSIQTQLNAKEGTVTAGTSSQYYRGDKSWATLDTSVVPENTNLYFTAARAKSATVADAIADSVIDIAPSQNAVYDALAGKISTSGGTLILGGTITGVPTPVNPSDVASKAYVDSAVAAATPSLDTDDVTEATNLYFTEARVRTSLLTGLNTGVAGPITATDSVLGAFGKLQYQVTDLKSYGQWTKTVNDLSYSAGDVTVEKNFKLKDSGSNFVLFKAPAAISTTYTLTMPTAKATSAGQALTSDTSGVLSWTTISDASVQAFAKSALPTCSAGQVLKSDGTNFSCVTDATGAGAFSGTANRAIASDGSGALTVSTTTATELGYVSGVTSSIQNQLNAKEGSLTAGTSSQYYRGDKSWATLDTSIVPENTNLYFTQARAIASPLTGFSATNSAIVASDTILQGFNKAQGQISANATSIASKADLTNVTQTITAATVTGLTTPLAGADAANKTYVDTQIESTPGLGIKIPASSVMLMQTCPTGWTTVGTTAGGPGGANCGSSGCSACQSPSTPSDLPASSTILMENCPSSWTTYGGIAGNQAAGINGVAYLSCQSPATNVLIPQGAKIYMGTSCPANWTDLGFTAAGPNMATSTLGSHHVCQAPGFPIPVRTIVGSTATTGIGAAVYMQGGGGLNGGAVSISAGAPTESAGSNVVITASSGASATATARDGGSISIGAGNGVNNGSGGNINLNAGNLSGTGSNGAVLVNNGNLGIGISSPTEKLDVAGNANLTGKLRLKDSSANYVELKAPSTVTSTYTLTFPATAGSSNQVLTTDGAGVLSWTTPATGGAPSGSAGGDLSGTYPNPTISGLAATKIGGGAVDNTEFGYLDGVTSAIQTQLNAKQASITAGTTSQYYRGDKTWATLDTSAVSENTNLYFTQARVLATPLTGFSATNSIIAATDTILQGFNKAQGQLSAHTTSLSSKADQTNLTQTITAAAITGLSSPIAGSDAANKTYVDNAISGNGVWAKSSSNIYFNTGNVGIGTTSPNAALDVNGTIRATQICDSVGSNCKTISSGWGAAAASIVASWPDAIYCNNGTDASILYHDTRESSSNLEWYTKSSGGGGHSLRFNATTGAAYDNTNFTGYSACTGKSITTLVSEGKTFGLLGGGVDWTVSGSNIYRAGGKVGIGTSNPAVDLDVVGSITGISQTRSANSAAAPDLFFQKDRGTPGSPAIISSGDALGHISFKGYDGASYIRGARIASLTTGAPATNQMTADLEFYTNNGSSDATERMRIEANGNIGIGTSVSSSYQHGGTNRVLGVHNPGTTQHSQSHLVISTGSTLASSSIGSVTAAVPGSSATNKGVGYVGFTTGANSTVSNPTGEIVMATRGASDTNWAQRLIINEGGNVGIGTALGAPLQRLQVQGASGSQTLFQVNNSDFVNASSVGSGAYIGTYGASGDVASMVQAFRAGNTASTSLLLNPFSGTVGVNTPTPNTAYSFDVNGSARINAIKGGQLNGAGNFHVDASGTGAFYVNWSAGTGGLYVGNGTNSGYAAVYASAFNVSSDKTLKKNITRIENPLDIILNINGVKFDWINQNESKDRQVGVIAQDVQKVIPEIVTMNKQTKKLTVNYASLVAPIIEAVKELYHKWFDDSAVLHRKIASVKVETETKMSKLEQQLENQKKTNEKLESENKMMKAYLCSKDEKAPFCH